MVKCLVAVTIMVIALPAQANERARLVLLSDPRSELTRRLHAEAAEVGLALVGPSSGQDDDPPGRLAERYGAGGVIRVASPTTVELWFLPREGGAPQHVMLRAQSGEEASFAFRVVEEVRARMIELRLPEGDSNAPGSRLPAGKGPTEGANAEPPVTPAQTERADARARGASPSEPSVVALSGGIGATSAEGGMGTTVHAALGLRATLASRWSATAQALLPWTRNGFSGLEGSASAGVYLFTGQVNRVVWRSDPSWSATLGAGAGAVMLAMKSEGAEGYVGKADRLTGAVFFGNAELAVSLTSWLALRGSLLAGSSAPRPVVRFGEREVVTWGRLFGTGIVALDFGVPLGSPGPGGQN
jgi:hypothetical protein